MGCSQPKLSRTGLRNILAFLKVELHHCLGGTQALLRLPEGRGLKIYMNKWNEYDYKLRISEFSEFQHHVETCSNGGYYVG